jgi:predicted dehydrogenase
MDWRKSGTVAVDLHIHDVDFIRYLFGAEPDMVQSCAARDSEGVIQHIFSNYTFGDAIVSSESSWDFPQNYPFTADFQINAEKGTFIYKDGKLTVYPDDEEAFVPDLEVAWEKAVSNHGNISNLEIYYLELRYFVDAFLGLEETKVPLSDAVKTLELIYKEIELCGGMQKL